MTTPIEEMEAAVDDLGWLEANVPVATWGRDPRREWLEVRVLVKAPVLEGTDLEVRRGLYLQAEEIIRRVERRGFKHLRVPIIELGGDLDPGMSEARIVHKCELRLEVTQ